ncbi:MAG: glycosyltransferase family 4 protein [Alistipes sp.]|nr:glycosyltransferase family 4 protein [Alistipes sp.]
MSLKKILQICSYYSDNHLYKEIFTRLDSEYEQTVFVPQKINVAEKNQVTLQHGKLIYSRIFGFLDRFFFFSKIKKAYKNLCKQNIQANFIHAHNLFTDGVLAYKMHKAYGTRYIVAVRLTDIFLQYKYFLYRRPLINKVLKSAEKIIFISPIQIEQLLSFVSDKKLKEIISGKSIAISNGINSYWIDNLVQDRKPVNNKTLKLLFVGRIVKVKNIFRIISAVDLLREKGEDVELTIIGGEYHSEHDYYSKFIETINDKKYINYLGEIWDKDKIKAEYAKNDIFIMPSLKELFGLTYIESISQNTPVIYSQSTGIMPFLVNKEFAVCVDQMSIESIANGILTIRNRLKSIGVFSSFAKDYHWDNIVEKYKVLYNE